MSRARMKLLEYLRDTAVFAPCYVLLDWVSYIHPLGPFNITPWNPQPALAIVWMLLGGIVHLPMVLVTIFVADLLIRDAPAGYGVTALTALVLSAGYGAIATTLRLTLRPSPNLHGLPQLTIFVAVVVAGTALIAAAFVGVLRAAGQLDAGAAIPGWLQFWIGDAVGVLVTAPALLVVTDAQRRRRLKLLLGRGETYLQAALVAAVLWLIFRGLGGDPAHHFYLLFPPLIWIAIRSGMVGAMLAILMVQLGVVLGIHQPSPQPLPIIELQALVAALTLTGLYLGLTVDERERAAEGWKQSLRLAAAGEMAGAIAHEVNQPLTALANYGRAGQLLIQAGRGAELGSVIDRMLAEAQRAAEVVRRLRDFFRQGSTRLERVPVMELLQQVRRTARDGKRDSQAEVTVAADETLPDLLVDRLQIELVLRNLVANAMEAVALRPSGEVSITAERHDAQHVRIVVADNGPGVADAEAQRVFEPFVSNKPTGMGLGLAVSRAIAQAHGGSLDARPAPHGEFHLILPTETRG